MASPAATNDDSAGKNCVRYDTLAVTSESFDLERVPEANVIEWAKECAVTLEGSNQHERKSRILFTRNVGDPSLQGNVDGHAGRVSPISPEVRRSIIARLQLPPTCFQTTSPGCAWGPGRVQKLVMKAPGGRIERIVFYFDPPFPISQGGGKSLDRWSFAMVLDPSSMNTVCLVHGLANWELEDFYRHAKHRVTTPNHPLNALLILSEVFLKSCSMESLRLASLLTEKSKLASFPRGAQDRQDALHEIHDLVRACIDQKRLWEFANNLISAIQDLNKEISTVSRQQGFDSQLDKVTTSFGAVVENLRSMLDNESQHLSCVIEKGNLLLRTVPVLATIEDTKPNPRSPPVRDALENRPLYVMTLIMLPAASLTIAWLSRRP